MPPGNWETRVEARMGVRSGNFGQTMKVEATESADDLHVGVRGRGNLILPNPHKGAAVSRKTVGRSGTT